MQLISSSIRDSMEGLSGGESLCRWDVLIVYKVSEHVEFLQISLAFFHLFNRSILIGEFFELLDALTASI